MEFPGALEWIGFVTGIIGVWLTSRQNPWCFPIGLVNVWISLFLLIGQHLYADAMQQVVYVVLLGMGWYNWTRQKKDKPTLQISWADNFERLLTLCAIILITFALGFTLDRYTDASYPWLDSFATSLAFSAQHLIARKKIENWLLWIPVNLIYIGIYLQKDLLLYVLLFTVYLGMAINGYQTWIKSKTSDTLINP